MDANYPISRLALGRRALWALAVGILMAQITGCGPAAGAAVRPTAPGSGASKLGPDPAAPGGLTVVLPASDLAVGKDQRFLLALLDADNRMVIDAKVDLLFAKVTGPNEAQPRSNATTKVYPYRGVTEGGIYVARAEFNEAGDWGVIARVARPGKETVPVNAAFKVKETSSTPGLGQPVPASRTLTGRTAAEIEVFSSARPVDPSLHRVSIAEALRQNRPLVVLFATPGFCSSRTCGPNFEVFQALHNAFQDRATFVYVDVYKNGKPPEHVPAVVEWGLPSEPWTFVVGADGRLLDKFEGAITVDELQPRLAELLPGA